MAESLEEMKDRLKAAFGKVMDIAEDDLAISTIPNRTLAADLYRAAAQMAQAVNDIEKKEQASEVAELREQVRLLTDTVLEMAGVDTKETSKRPSISKAILH